MMRKVLAVGLALLLILNFGSAAGLVAGSETSQQQNGEPSVAVSAERDGSAMVYDIEIADLTGVDRLSLVVGRNAEVTRIEGGEVVESDGRTRVEWSGDEQFRVVIRAGTGTVDSGGTEYFEGDGWMLARVPYAEVRWWDAGSDQVHRQRPLGDRVDHLADDATGVYGDRYALVGDRTTVTHQAHGQQFRIVSPTDTALAADVDEVRATLDAASQQLQVGDRDQEVLLFALPEPARRGGESVPARDEAWLRADSPVDDPNNVWVHEYVHTRQSFRLERDMRWFREASAEYYAARLTYEQGRISRTEMLDHFADPEQGERLTAPDEWSNRRVPYTKGARVLAVLDRNIRQTSNGQHSLADVFRRMNQHEGAVSYTEFKAIVAEVAGHPMDAWLDRYVAGDAAIASVSGPPVEAGIGVSLDRVIGGAGQGVVFMGVSTALSFVAAFPLYLVLRRTGTDWARDPRLRLPQLRRKES
jgi:hypothetical protein